jgi:hypothetical protein
MGDLQRLKNELTNACGAPSDHARTRAERLRETPLLHCVRRPRDLRPVLAATCLLSRRQRNTTSPQNSSEVELDIDDRVYASVGYVYLPATVALVFRASIEDASVEATPWDTGMFVARLTPSWSQAERRRFHHMYSLPSPEYRSYLVACAASLFQDPAHYLTGGPMIRQIPVELTRNGRMAQTFEAKFFQRITTSADQLQAVFLDQRELRSMPDEVKRWLQGLSSAGVLVRSLVTSRAPLPMQIEDYLLRELGLDS